MGRGTLDSCVLALGWSLVAGEVAGRPAGRARRVGVGITIGAELQSTPPLLARDGRDTVDVTE